MENALASLAKPGWGAGLSTAKTETRSGPTADRASPRTAPPPTAKADPLAQRAPTGVKEVAQRDAYRDQLHREDRSKRHANGEHAKPTKAPLQERQSAPAAYATSGLEAAMGQLADKLHKRTFKGPHKGRR